MFRRIIFLTVICYSSFVNSQTKVAILDFENTSGISKYDGFGKALSNMLITDLKNSIHPRKVTFLERSQLNKILSEQNLQKSKNFDKSTAVSFGKLAGVKFVLVGSVYVLDGTCNISSRLVDVQTSEIVHAKESNGKITNWLSLKSILANELSNAMNNPVTIEADFTNKETSEAVLTQYVKVIDKMDEGDVDGAQEMTEMLSAIQPDFKYFDELMLDIEELKKQVKQNTEDIEVLKSSGDLIINASTIKEYKQNLSSDLLTSAEKNLIFLEMVQNFSDSVLSANEPPSYWSSYFLSYPFSDVGFIKSQIDTLYKINEKRNQKYFAKLILSELNNELIKFSVYNYQQPNKSIEDKFHQTVQLYDQFLRIYYERFIEINISFDEYLYIMSSNVLFPEIIKHRSYSSVISTEYTDLRQCKLSSAILTKLTKSLFDPNVIKELEIINSKSSFISNEFSRILDWLLYHNLVETRRIENLANTDIWLKANLMWMGQQYQKRDDCFLTPTLVDFELRRLMLPIYFGCKGFTIIESGLNLKDTIFGVMGYEVNHPYYLDDVDKAFFLKSRDFNKSDEFQNYHELTDNFVQEFNAQYFEFMRLNYNPIINEIKKKTKSWKEFKEQLEQNQYFHGRDSIARFYYSKPNLDYSKFIYCDMFPTGSVISIDGYDTIQKNNIYGNPKQERVYVSEKFISINTGGKLKENEVVMHKDASPRNSTILWSLKPNSYYRMDDNCFWLLSFGYYDDRFDIFRELFSESEDKSMMFGSILTGLKESNERRRLSLKEEILKKELDLERAKKELAENQKKSLKFCSNVFAANKIDTTDLLNLNKSELLNIYNWYSYATNLKIVNLFNRSYEDLIDTTQIKTINSLNRLLLYQLIVNYYFQNINDQILVISNPPNNFEIDVKDFKYASAINTAHTFLVYLFKFNKNEINQAIKMYQEIDLKYEFGEDFYNWTSSKMIIEDLDDLSELGLIDLKTKNKVIKTLNIEP